MSHDEKKSRKIHRLEIPPSKKNNETLTFLILPASLSPKNEEKSKRLRVLMVEEGYTGFLSAKKPKKTRKIVIKSLNSLTFLKKSNSEESNFVNHSAESSSLDELRIALGEGNPGNEKKSVFCKCKKSHCLKLYCECFLAQRFCGSQCTCIDCSNIEKYEEKRNKFIETVKEKNPKAFIPKISQNLACEQDSGKHNKGCNCRKSSCVKKYCECYQNGVKCSDLCKCEDCKNGKLAIFWRKPLAKPELFALKAFGENDINSQNFHMKNGIEKGPFNENFDFEKRFKAPNTTKHQLSNFNSFYKIKLDGKEELSGRSEDALRDGKEGEEWGWEFSKSQTVKKSV